MVDFYRHQRSPPQRTSTLKTGDVYEVGGRSLLLLAALTSGEPATVIRRLALDLLHDAEQHEHQPAGELLDG